MDEIDDLLKPRPTPNRIDREAILRQSVSVLRQRRRQRALLHASAWAACFVAGGLCARWLYVGTDNQLTEIVHQPEKTQPTGQPVDPFAGAPPVRIERWAGLTEGDKRLQLYRRAGDEYLNQGDQLAALRCYRLALKSAKPDDLVVHPQEDTWMLMALKFDRQKETNDAKE